MKGNSYDELQRQREGETVTVCKAAVVSFWQAAFEQDSAASGGR